MCMCSQHIVARAWANGCSKRSREHPDLVPLRRMLLATRDAHSLYAHYGFSALQSPERWMERFREQA